VSTMKTFTLAVALLVEVTADENFRRLGSGDAEPEDPWMELFENTRGMGRKIYEYLSLEDMESMIQLRPSTVNYHEIFPVYKRKLETTYSEAWIARLDVLAPLNEDNLYSFVTKMQSTRSRDVRQLAAQGNDAGGGPVLAELAKMVLTDKIRKIIERIGSWFQDEELDVEDDPIMMRTIYQLRNVLRRSEFGTGVDVLGFPLRDGETECGYISISFDRHGKLTVEYDGRQTTRSSVVYRLFSPSRADIISRRWTKYFAANVLEELKDNFGASVTVNWGDVNESIDFLVFRLTESSSVEPNAIEL